MPRPPGLYEELVTRGFARELTELESQGFIALQSTPNAAEARVLLARHLLHLLTRALSSPSADEVTDRQLEVARRVQAALSALDGESAAPDDVLIEPPRLLTAILPRGFGPAPPQHPVRPEVPLTASDLLVNARGEPRIGHSIAAEIPSADRIDLVCAFIRWHGVRVIEEPLREFRERGRPLESSRRSIRARQSRRRWIASSSWAPKSRSPTRLRRRAFMRRPGCSRGTPAIRRHTSVLRT